MRDARRIEERDQGAGSLRFQVIATTAGVLGLLVLAFGLGYMVGHRAGGVQLAESDEAHLDPLAKLDAERQAHDKMNFYSQLTQESPAGKDALPPPAALVPPVPTPLPATPPGVSEEQAVNAAPAEKPRAAKRVEPKPEKKPEKKAEKLHAVEAPHVLKALAAGPAKSGEFTVQVSSFQTHAEARAFSASLERQGFKPFVVQATIPHKGTWYRVRLGRFDDEGVARQAKTVLGKADIPGWVLRSE